MPLDNIEFCLGYLPRLVQYLRGHGNLPDIVDERGEPAGILSAKAIVQYMVDHVPLSVYTLPPRPGQVEREREGA